ncbi:hypothetical protein AEYBE204_10560 [Asticcacaulis sp. YBE204]|nr:hypothetical protein AEYBE204_10560 [Asticcacaulis sp. YBE204]
MGLGLIAGRWLHGRGHEVILHGRNAQRTQDARGELPNAFDIVTGDLSTMAGARSVAEQVNAIGDIDAVIHNAAVGYQEPAFTTDDGLPHLFAINTLAPFILTALIEKPRRLVYMSSGMHKSAHAHIGNLLWEQRSWNASAAYAETKLHNAMLAFYLARFWPDVPSNAVEPGWVATKMGGPGAPDDLIKGGITQAWLAEGVDPDTHTTGKYWFHQRVRPANPEAHDARLQDQLISELTRISGHRLPT